MEDFPEFMRQPANRIHSSSDYVSGLAGYVFDGADGSQIAFWTSPKAGTGALHSHPFDEYVVVVQGRYTVSMEGRTIPLEPGQEILIPKGIPHNGERIAGTRTIHAFGGKRAVRELETTP
jgi:quercetin dioxygenase-like cupin family protein